MVPVLRSQSVLSRSLRCGSTGPVPSRGPVVTGGLASMLQLMFPQYQPRLDSVCVGLRKDALVTCFPFYPTLHLKEKQEEWNKVCVSVGERRGRDTNEVISKAKSLSFAFCSSNFMSVQLQDSECKNSRALLPSCATWNLYNQTSLFACSPPLQS